MSRSASSLGAGVAAMVVLAGALGGTPAPARAHYVNLANALVEPGVFTFGVSLVGRPFAQRTDGELGGFEVDVARLVADAHGLGLRVVAIARDRMSTALVSGEVDAASTLALDEPGMDVAVVPYLVLGDHLMVLKGNPFRVHAEADLAGRTVAVDSGSSAERYALRINADLAAAGRDPMNVHSFPLARFTHFPVSIGHAAGYFVGTVRAVGISRDPDSRTALVASVFSAAREAGFGLRRANENLLHAVEHAIAAAVATGRFESLLERHTLPPILDPYRRR